MYKVLKRTCCAIVHTIRSFVFPCPRCRRRRGLLKVPSYSLTGVTTSRATSWAGRNDRNTSGQRVNKFNNSYRDISVIVAENNSLLKPKCQQYTSLNKMLSNFSKVLMAHISFTAVINNGGIGKGIGGIWKGTKKNYIYVL